MVVAADILGLVGRDPEQGIGWLSDTRKSYTVLMPTLGTSF